MLIDAIVAEIGSTTTVVNAFDGLSTNHPCFLGQGYASTTPYDVTIGLQNAINDLKQNLNASELHAKDTFACSSAAGGLKMSVHGLVYDMTVRASKEAALGAGANLHLVTAGELTRFDLDKIKKLNLNIIMIAGGVDYGETKTALYNAKCIADLKLNIPVIYAGNCVIHDAIQSIFEDAYQSEYLTIIPNVYPKIDTLNVEPARKIIQNVFENHITKAPGMEHVRTLVNQTIIPTPGGVLQASILLQKAIGDLVTIDIGGATTDVHSVTSGSPEIENILISPEPFAKRTVEGDLGVFVNRENIIQLIGFDQLAKDLGISLSSLNELLANYQSIPSPNQIPLVERLAYEALVLGIERHAGRLTNIYGTKGKTRIAEGKDLTAVSYIIGTGGALTRLPHRKELIAKMLDRKDDISLKPLATTKILIDNHYIMATLGVLSSKYPIASLQLLKESLSL